MIARLSLLLPLLLVAGLSRAAEMKSLHQLDEFFADAGVEGTFVACDASDNSLVGCNAPRAGKRFIPASTFKIPNTIIGLETGAVPNVDIVLPYGGKPQPFPQWEHDMPLREALPLSAVPIYQELARRIGLERMRAWVKKLAYGNEEIGDVVDQFWLVGPLEISAIEQTQFLARLVRGELPAKPAAIRAVSEITIIEKTKDYVLHAKTGWGTSTKPDIGWWVGWVERGGKIHTFALNLDAPKGFDMKKRLEIGKGCLRALGILPQS